MHPKHHPGSNAAAPGTRSWRKALWLPACAAMLAPAAACAQGIKPLAKLDSASILIGQQAHIDLSVTYRADQGPVNIQWPLITDTVTSKVLILHDSHLDTILPDKEHDPYLFRQERRLSITAWDSGYWAIPPFVFTINGDTVGTDPLLLTVHTVPVDTTQAIRDIKEIYSVPFSLVDWMQEHARWIGIGLAAAALLTALFIVLYKRARRPAPPPPAQPQLPLHVRTLLALEALNQKKLWQQGHVKPYYSELTDILRGYIQERYQVHAMEQTTDELLAALRLGPMPRGQQDALGALLRLADMVKFAKWNALPAENEQAMASAVRMVQETADTPSDAPLA